MLCGTAGVVGTEAAGCISASSFPPVLPLVPFDDEFVIVTRGLAGIRAGGGVNASFARRDRMVAK